MQSPLPQRWSTLDFGLYAFLAISPLAFGLWMFSLAPLVGGNLFVATAAAGGVAVLGAVVLGSLASTWPLSGGDYAWQTRFLGRPVGAVVALASWWLAVIALAPVCGNLFVVQVLDPLLSHADWDGVANWFHSRAGTLAASLLAITVAASFVELGMRRAAIALRVLVAIGAVSFAVVIALLLTSEPNEFSERFDEQAADVYGAGLIPYGQTLYVGTFDARASELEPSRTLALVPLVLLFGLWIGWAGPLAAEIRGRRPDSARAALVRAAFASTLVSLLLFVAIGIASSWEFWNELNNLYWGTVYDTTATSLLPTWPSPVVLAAWLTDSLLVQMLIIAGMVAWVVGFTATLFLAATRVLVAAASDGLLPGVVARTRNDSVPTAALALLVVPACAVALLHAYWDAFADASGAAALALAATTAASGLAAVRAHARNDRRLASAAALFTALVGAVAAAWISDPVFGLRSTGSLIFLAALYIVAATLYLLRSRSRSRSQAGATDAS